jgi:hypothetical protein
MFPSPCAVPRDWRSRSGEPRLLESSSRRAWRRRAPAWQREMESLSECKHMQITSRRFLYNSTNGYPLIWKTQIAASVRCARILPGLHSCGCECLSDDER